MSKIIALTLFLVTLSAVYYFFFYYPRLQTTEILINNQKFIVEIATTPAQKSRGLMYRSSLCPNCGMLFDFGVEGQYPFWMKNTLIPLDVIWLNQNGLVVDIKTGQPQDTKYLTNSQPARYVLETNPNATGLKIGDVLFINHET